MALDSSPEPTWDVVIVGAGPAALACLSALQEPYSLDALGDDATVQRANRCLKKGRQHLKSLKVVVVDPAPNWLDAWKSRFECLDVPHLRSPTLAHPDMFDSHALLAYAIQRGRQDELVESGCADLTQLLPLGQTQVGLWKLPGSYLFLDFCQHLVDRLEHCYRQGWVVDIDEGGKSSKYKVHLADGNVLLGNSVVLATGMVGQKPVIPPKVRASPRLIPWTSMCDMSCLDGCKSILVLGGGLTAVQAAMKIVASSEVCHVTLCSRRPIQERLFDLNVEWFDRRTTNKCMSDFYHLPVTDRLRLLREARNGGSVPAVYMSQVRALEKNGRLERIVGDAEYVNHVGGEKARTLTINVRLNDRTRGFQAVVLACGIQPDCESCPLYERILRRWPVPVIHGLPCLSADAEWTTPAGLFCVGGLASLSVGPDSGNLMGMRRAAELVAHALNRRSWLRSENVLKNPFDALESDSDSESDC